MQKVDQDKFTPRMLENSEFIECTVEEARNVIDELGPNSEEIAYAIDNAQGNATMNNETYYVIIKIVP